MLHDLLIAITIIGIIVALSSHLFLVAIGFIACLVMTVADLKFAVRVPPKKGAKDMDGGGR